MAYDIEILNALDSLRFATDDREEFDFIVMDLHEAVLPYTEFFEISDNQAIILCAFIYLSLNRNERISIQDLSHFFHVSITDVARQMGEINILKEKYIISEVKPDFRRSKGSFTYIVRPEIIEAVMLQDFSKLNMNMVFNFFEFFDYVSGLGTKKEYKEIRTEELRLQFTQLFEANEHLDFVKSLKSYRLNDTDSIIITIIASMLLESGRNLDIEMLLREIFDSRQEAFELLRDVRSGKSDLIAKNIIELTPGNFTSNFVRLTKDALNKLFVGQSVNLLNESTKMLGYSYKELGINKLFYPKEVVLEVKKLKSILSERKYQRAKKIMKHNRMSVGINILFYGPPGTGKTELAYQLARQSKRDVIPVDISSIKSKWFGESEKLIKQIFDDYHSVVEESNRVPILLFNEADAIFSKRMTNASSSVDQTQNAIQNILLQELEDFEGILIATTNLTDNLDKAFDRRFLFKLNIGMPDAESSFNIWKTMLPKVKKAFLKEVSNSFVLSGGQIENIARQIFLNEVLGDKDVTREVLLSLCNQELSLSQKSQRTSIGFINHKQAV